MRKYKKSSDIMIMSCLFLIIIIYIWSLITSKGENAVYLTYGNNHSSFWYPLQNSCTYLIFSIFLLIKSIRFKCCFFTKIASILYILLTSLTLFYTIFAFNYNNYLITISSIIYIFIFLMILSFIIRLCIKKL